MGMVGYYRRFCKNFSQVSAPLTDLLSTKRTFRWSDDCQQAFEDLKRLLCTAPVLQAPDISIPFTIQVDASDSGVGAVLLQRSGMANETSLRTHSQDRRWCGLHSVAADSTLRRTEDRMHNRSLIFSIARFILPELPACALALNHITLHIPLYYKQL
ncbi:uncharacterized protein LOC134776229 [Penaeus indicus]|uniref:uncharacterized protein LOC134776229 n=1 Tax=Penaeus indicus TaxID=29960 RepID=UPI00300C9A36